MQNPTPMLHISFQKDQELVQPLKHPTSICLVLHISANIYPSFPYLSWSKFLCPYLPTGHGGAWGHLHDLSADSNYQPLGVRAPQGTLTLSVKRTGQTKPHVHHRPGLERTYSLLSYRWLSQQLICRCLSCYPFSMVYFIHMMAGRVEIQAPHVPALLSLPLALPVNCRLYRLKQSTQFSFCPLVTNPIHLLLQWSENKKVMHCNWIYKSSMLEPSRTFLSENPQTRRRKVRLVIFPQLSSACSCSQLVQRYRSRQQPDHGLQEGPNFIFKRGCA